MHPAETSAVLRGAMLGTQWASPGGGADTAPTRKLDAVSSDREVQLSVAEIRERARLEGFREGREEGRRAGDVEARAEVLKAAEGLVDTAIREARSKATDEARREVQVSHVAWAEKQRDQLLGLVKSFSIALDKRVEDSEDDVLALTMEVTCKVFGANAVQPDMLRSAVAQAMAAAKIQPSSSVALHPSDLEMLRSLPDWDHWTSRIAPRVSWISRADIEMGGCIVSSPSGDLDARLDTQLRGFASILKEARRLSPSQSSGDASE